MNQEQKDTITTRVVSTVFTVLALAIFKPFGLQSWQWMAVAHLSAMGCLGFVSCALTEAILKHVIKKPRSLERGGGLHHQSQPVVSTHQHPFGRSAHLPVPSLRDE